MTMTFTTHILNGTDGTHAGGVRLGLYNRDSGERIFLGETNEGGRLQTIIAESQLPESGAVELVIWNGPFWEGRGIPRHGPQIVDEVVIRISLPERTGHYHVPLMRSPNSFSCWWSA